MKIKWLNKGKVIINGLLLSLFCVLFFIPFYWMFIASFKDPTRIFTDTLALLPETPTLLNYSTLLETSFFYWFLNSIIFATGYVILGVFICSLAAFAFSKYKFKFKNIIFMLIIASYMLPIHIQIVPLFIMLTRSGIINTYPGLILPLIANPMGVFFIRQYMIGIEDDLLNAARVDGASELQIFFKIVLPVSKPVLAAVGILFSFRAWNNLLWPLIVMRSEKMFTLTVGLSSLIGQYRPQYGLVMAGSVIALLPVLAFFLKMQDLFIAGLTGGSIKG